MLWRIGPKDFQQFGRRDFPQGSTQLIGEQHIATRKSAFVVRRKVCDRCGVSIATFPDPRVETRGCCIKWGKRSPGTKNCRGGPGKQRSDDVTYLISSIGKAPVEQHAH